jgi:hypothetical protein
MLPSAVINSSGLKGLRLCLLANALEERGGKVALAEGGNDDDLAMDEGAGQCYNMRLCTCQWWA